VPENFEPKKKKKKLEKIGSWILKQQKKMSLKLQRFCKYFIFAYFIILLFSINKKKKKKNRAARVSFEGLGVQGIQTSSFFKPLIKCPGSIKFD